MNDVLSGFANALKSGADIAGKKAGEVVNGVAEGMKAREDKTLGKSEVSVHVDPFTIFPLPEPVIQKTSFYSFAYSEGGAVVTKGHRLVRGTTQAEILHLATYDIVNFSECREAVGVEPGFIERIHLDELGRSVSFSFSSGNTVE